MPCVVAAVSVAGEKVWVVGVTLRAAHDKGASNVGNVSVVVKQGSLKSTLKGTCMLGVSWTPGTDALASIYNEII